jgi:hypothetical protein
MKTHWLYLIACGLHTKIGIAQDVKKRLCQIATTSPLKPCLIKDYGPFDYQEVLDAEAYLHWLLKHKNTNGEWFLLDMDNLAFIERRMNNGLNKPNGYWKSQYVESLDLWNHILEEQKCRVEDF